MNAGEVEFMIAGLLNLYDLVETVETEVPEKVDPEEETLL